MSQKTKYILNAILWTLISTVISGALLQTFMLESGITEEQVGHFVSLMQLVQTAVIFIFSEFADRVKNIIRLTAVSHLLYLPFMLLLTVISFTQSPIYGILSVFGVIAFIASGLYNVLSYKLPYCIMDMKHYGKWTGLSSLFSAGFMLILTVSLSLLQKKIGYFTTMKFFFSFAFVCTVLFIFLTASYQPIAAFAENTQHKKKISLFRYKPFTSFILPNLFRGFCGGMVSMAVTVGYFGNQLNAEWASVLLIITQCVSIPANFVYTRLTGKEPLLILTASLGILGFVSFMGSFSTVGFLICYAFAYFCVNIINVSVPVLVAKIVDYEVVGIYNGWRMLLNTLGSLLASLLCVPMLKAIGVTPTWLIAGGLQAVSGVWYYFASSRICKELK